MTESDYEIVLVPRGSALDRTEETKRMTVPASETAGRAEIHEAAVAHAGESGVMDQWACREHWTVANFVRTSGSAEQRLRDALLGCSLSDAAWQDLEPRKLEVLDDRRGGCRSALLALEKPVSEELFHWWGEIKAEYEAALWAKRREVDAAMIEAVAAANPEVAELALEDPVLAHYTFAQTCLSNGERVVDALR